MTNSIKDIQLLIETYFEGLFTADTGLLRQVFHPKAIYACASDGDLLFRHMEEYFAVVGKRVSPQVRGEARTDSIRALELAGPVTARATVHCSIGDRYFTDFLTFVHTGGRWQIMAKVFHSEPLAPPVAA
jgi:hypothetical protein